MTLEVSIAAGRPFKSTLGPLSNSIQERPSASLFMSLAMFFVVVAMLLPAPDDLPCGLTAAGCFLTGAILHIGDKKKKAVPRA